MFVHFNMQRIMLVHFNAQIIFHIFNIKIFITMVLESLIIVCYIKIITKTRSTLQ